jgi:hypothetical protein
MYEEATKMFPIGHPHKVTTTQNHTNHKDLT